MSNVFNSLSSSVNGVGALMLGAKEIVDPPFTLHVISRRSGKCAVAEFASNLAHSQRRVSAKRPVMSVADLKSVLEGMWLTSSCAPLSVSRDSTVI